MNSTLYFTNAVTETINSIIDDLKPSSIFVLVDSNTSQFALPMVQSECPAVSSAKVISIPAGDMQKSLETVTSIWQQLSTADASRHSLLINLGGGVVSDMGGFAASTFKRGLTCVNVPTTLLAAVDASVGGKTGINFNGCKNQIGTFAEPYAVIISTIFFTTLTPQELLSGYAEMIKHALLSNDDDFAMVMRYQIAAGPEDPDRLLELLRKSVAVKSGVVENDPTEKGLRKCLNLGHTAAHAIEALAMRRAAPVPHGYAVAWGLVIEGVLSNMIEGFDSTTLHTLADYVRKNYLGYNITCDDYDELIGYMRQDKKNVSADAINFTLLKAIGDPVIDCTVDPDKIKAALDIYRDLMGF